MDLSGLLVILLCLALGLAMRVGAGLPAGSHRALNAYVLWVPLPALMLAKLPPMFRDGQLLKEAWLPVSMAWLQFALALCAGVLLGRWLKLSRAQQGALVLTMGLGNTSFVGFPVLVACFGPDALPWGILVDQPGSFLVLASLGLLVAAHHSGMEVGWKDFWGRLKRFPPIWALVAEVALAFSPWTFPIWCVKAFDGMAASLVPAALVAVGMQMAIRMEALQRHSRPLLAGLTVKLLLAPALAALLYLHWLGQKGLGVQVTLTEAMMPPMVTAAILAEEMGLDGELAALMVVLGMIISWVTIPLWLFGLGFIG